MKILVVQDRLRSGGTERQSLLLARSFLETGHATRLLTFRPGGALATTAEPVPTQALQPFDTGLDWFAPGLSRSVRDHRPDIVLCMGRMANCYAGHIQTVVPHATTVATFRTGKSLPSFFRRSLKQVRHIVANGHDARQVLESRYAVASEKISVIHNGLVFAPATPTSLDTDLRARHGAGPTTLVLLNVAMFRPEKNQRELIEIATALPLTSDWQLWLVGEGPERARCERIVAERGLTSHIRFFGFVANPSAYYEAADLAVMVSHRESLSNFLIEAQAHGLPALAYNIQGAHETMLPDVTGWIVPAGDRNGFIRWIESCLAEPDSRLRLKTAGQTARTFARTAFSPERQTTAYLALFDRLLHDKSAGSLHPK